MPFKPVYAVERSVKKIPGIICGSHMGVSVVMSLSKEVLDIVSPKRDTCGVSIGYDEDVGKILITKGKDFKITTNGSRGFISIKGVLKRIAKMLAGEESVEVYIEPQAIVEENHAYFDFFNQYSSSSSSKKLVVRGLKKDT